MKTKGAYAFRDFDAARILQRPYFRKLNLPQGDDANILKSLQAVDGDSVDNMEEKIVKLKAIHKRLGEFLQLINRHIAKRLAPYSAAKNENITFAYVTALFFVRDLGNKISKIFGSLDKEVQRRYKKDFSERLKQERKARGLTQKELGDLINVSPQAFSLYERGERDFPVHVIIRLAKILNISGDKILGFSAN